MSGDLRSGMADPGDPGVIWEKKDLFVEQIFRFDWDVVEKYIQDEKEAPRSHLSNGETSSKKYAVNKKLSPVECIIGLVRLVLCDNPQWNYCRKYIMFALNQANSALNRWYGFIDCIVFARSFTIRKMRSRRFFFIPDIFFYDISIKSKNLLNTKVFLFPRSYRDP